MKKFTPMQYRIDPMFGEVFSYSDFEILSKTKKDAELILKLMKEDYVKLIEEDEDNFDVSIAGFDFLKN